MGHYALSANNISGWLFDAGQPTTHFNVLRERGEDPRLVRIDHAAPLFFVTPNPTPSNARLLFAVAAEDIPGRLEQTRLLLRTMEVCGYAMEHVTLQIMKGFQHCGYPIETMAMQLMGL